MEKDIRKHEFYLLVCIAGALFKIVWNCFHSSLWNYLDIALKVVCGKVVCCILLLNSRKVEIFPLKKTYQLQYIKLKEWMKILEYIFIVFEKSFSVNLFKKKVKIWQIHDSKGSNILFNLFINLRFIHQLFCELCSFIHSWMPMDS